MKTFKNSQIKVEGNKFTITGEISDYLAVWPVQQTTIVHKCPNGTFRHVHISQDAIFVKAFREAFSIPHDELVKWAKVVEPKLNSAPRFAKQQIEPDLKANISSELQPDIIWQSCDDQRLTDASKWSEIEGQKGEQLDKASVKKGQWVRCVASSESGSMTSNPVLIQ